MPRKIRRIGRVPPVVEVPPKPVEGMQLYKNTGQAGHKCNTCVHRFQHVYKQWNPDFPERAWCPVTPNTVYRPGTDQVTECGAFMTNEPIPPPVEVELRTGSNGELEEHIRQLMSRPRQRAAGTVSGRTVARTPLPTLDRSVVPEESVCHTCVYRDRIRTHGIHRQMSGAEETIYECQHTHRHRRHGLPVRVCSVWEPG